MKILNVCTGWVSHTQWIRDDAKAEAAYDAIKKAVAEYERFKNDRQDVVTVDTGDGRASFRIENIVSVSIDDLNAESEETVIERHVWDGRIKAKIAARLAPAE